MKKQQPQKEQQPTLLQFNLKEQEWQQYHFPPSLQSFSFIDEDSHSQAESNNQKSHCNSSTFKSLTFNVLFDVRKAKQGATFLQKVHLKFSKERYLHIFKEIKIIDPDVATFNEVTVGFVELLQQDQFVQANYLISKSAYNHKTKHDIQGNMIIVKKILNPFKVQKLYLESHDQPVPIVFWLGGQKITTVIAVASIHLLAFKGNIKERQIQLTQIVEKIKNHSSQYKIKGAQKYLIAILQGDMNFHSEEQNVIIPKLELRDCWLERYDNDLQKYPGFTFDSLENGLIKQAYWGYEKRRMRLDRMFILQVNKVHSDSKWPNQPKQVGNQKRIEQNYAYTKQIQIVLNKPIYEGNVNPDMNNFFGRGILSFIGDYFGKNWLREKQLYLFPSDHFGLLAQIQIKNIN